MTSVFQSCNHVWSLMEKSIFCILFCVIHFSAQDPFLFSTPVVDLCLDFVLLYLVLSLCPCFNFCSPR
jgi:hypothetical protein